MIISSWRLSKLPWTQHHHRDANGPPRHGPRQNATDALSPTVTLHSPHGHTSTKPKSTAPPTTAGSLRPWPLVTNSTSLSSSCHTVPRIKQSKSPTMTRSRTKSPILVLDGTGVVPSRIARRLVASSADKHPLLVASILGEDPNGVKFNLYDSNTWENPFVRAQELFGSDNEMESDGMIHSIYLTAPNSPPSNVHVHSHSSRTSTLAASDEQQEERAPSPSPSQQASLLMQFVDYARLKHGTRRFVLQSASAMEPGGFSLGRVHAYLRELGQRGEAEWAVLRPTWCQQDFEQPCHVKSIKEENRLYSATSRGKIPWVSADDIAAVAVEALTSEDAPNTEYLVLGPELLGYDDIASILSSVLGRKIIHVDLSSHALERRQQSFGCSEEHSRLMSSLDTAIKYGTENRTNDVVLSMTGNKPKSFREYAESVKHLWV